jgi:hypothetical protein
MEDFEVMAPAVMESISEIPFFAFLMTNQDSLMRVWDSVWWVV